MAKLKSDPITQSDLVEFVENQSDFSFEIKVLKELTGRGFICEHGGSYSDPKTNKTRQFDIRAEQVFFEKFFLRLAVECKNLRSNCPLLVSCMPRRNDESYHEISISVDPEVHLLEEPPEAYCRAELRRSKNVRVSGDRSLYRPGEPVGKSCDQVGRLANGNEFYSGDSDVYEKWSQALSSAYDLTYSACTDGKDRADGGWAMSRVFPVLVVPNGQLWMTQYDSDGNRIKNPVSVDRCSYFVNLAYAHRGAFLDDRFTISHLEFVTVNGLLAFVDELCGDRIRLDTTFPIGYVIQAISELAPDQ